MSSVVIAGNTSGTVTLSAPDVAGTTTLTLPSTSGNVITSANIGSNLPTGSVLQVVEASYKTAVTFNVSTFTSTGVTASITPSSASNKVLVMVKLDFGSSDGGGSEGARTRLYRNGSDISDARGDDSSARQGSFITHPCYNGDGVGMLTEYGQYLDSPSSTSSVEYRIYIRNYDTSGSYPVYLNRTNSDSDMYYTPRGVCRITLMEIKG
jgi:hypothetical protein